jgi:hypothetical protein
LFVVQSEFLLFDARVHSEFAAQAVRLEKIALHIACCTIADSQHSISLRETRKLEYKKGLDSEEARRKREDGLQSIRKKKQQDQVSIHARARFGALRAQHKKKKTKKSSKILFFFGPAREATTPCRCR